MNKKPEQKLADLFFSVLYSADESRVSALMILLNKVLLVTSALVFIISCVALWTTTIIVAAINFFFYLFLLFYLRNGHIRFASIGCVLMLLGSVSYVVYKGNGVHDVGIILYPTVLIFGSLILNRFYFVVLTVLSAASFFSIGTAHYLGYVDNKFTEFVEYADVIVTTVLIIFSGVAIRLLTEYSISAFQRATEKEHQFSEILNTLYDAVIILDAEDGSVIDVNRTMLSMFGYERQDIGSFTMEMLTADTEEFSAEAAKEYFKQSRNEGTSNFRWRGKKSDGTLFWADVSLKLTQIDNIERIVVIVRDIDLQLRMEEQLKQAEKLTAIGQLAGGIAHDFNNMLSGIIGAAEVLSLQNQREEDREMLDLIINTSQQASELTGKLLSFSKKRHIVFERVNINEVIEEAFSILRSSIDKRINVITDLDDEFNKIKGDRTQLINAFLNLGINAKDAMAGEGVISCSSSRVQLSESFCRKSPFDLKPGDYLDIRVVDDGAGISSDALEHIFEPFFSTKPGNRHTGLGLSAVYGIIVEHKGAIEVISEPEQGTTFNLYLPLADEQTDSQKNQPVLKKGKGCILIIDDEDIIVKSAGAMLQRLGYTVLSASGGAEGIEVYRVHQTEIDLVLLDMQMPGMNGPDCFKTLQEINADQSILLSSGFSEDSATHRLLEAGASGFISKPYTMQNLSSTVAASLID